MGGLGYHWGNPSSACPRLRQVQNFEMMEARKSVCRWQLAEFEAWMGVILSNYCMQALRVWLITLARWLFALSSSSVVSCWSLAVIGIQHFVPRIFMLTFCSNENYKLFVPRVFLLKFGCDENSTLYASCFLGPLIHPASFESLVMGPYHERHVSLLTVWEAKA